MAYGAKMTCDHCGMPNNKKLFNDGPGRNICKDCVLIRGMVHRQNQ